MNNIQIDSSTYKDLFLNKTNEQIILDNKNKINFIKKLNDLNEEKIYFDTISEFRNLFFNFNETFYDYDFKKVISCASIIKSSIIFNYLSLVNFVIILFYF